MATKPDQPGVPCSNANEGRAAHNFDPADGVHDEDALKSCTVCDSDAKMRCSTCGTWYCNRECSMKDWPLHKALCKAVKDEFNVDKAPTEHVRAILFPADSDKPTWIWISLKTMHISVVRALGITMKKPLKKRRNALAVNDINKSLTHRKIGHGIRQFTAPKARPQKGLNVNVSILALGDPGSVRPYFGSAVFICFRTYEANGITKVCYEDAAPRDLRMIIEWYYTRPDNPCISQLHRLPIKSYGRPGEEGALWPAVRIICDGDIVRFCTFSNKDFEIIQNVQVVSKDVSGIRSPCEFAALAGLPWVVQPCRSTIDPINDRDNYLLLRNWAGRIYAQNKTESFQHWNLNSTDSWTLPEYLSSTQCGSLLVLHKDGGRIDKLHVACFIQYVEIAFEQAVPLLIRAGEPMHDIRVITSRVELAPFITKEGFEAFWLDFIKAKVGRLAPAYPSPYNDIYGGETDPVPMAEEEVKQAREKVEKLLLEGA
ncbi:hypothetical protein F4823DRAFT_627781 [Ustulina deusta]|nr:hypothetical protein F4823DRAFT_627781 [Ustulina deusta]